VDVDKIVGAIKRCESELTQILGRFTNSRDSIDIERRDDPKFRQIMRELVDLFNDIFGPNSYSYQIAHEFEEGVSNYLGRPSTRSSRTSSAWYRPNMRSGYG